MLTSANCLTRSFKHLSISINYYALVTCNMWAIRFQLCCYIHSKLCVQSYYNLIELSDIKFVCTLANFLERSGLFLLYFPYKIYEVTLLYIVFGLDQESMRCPFLPYKYQESEQQCSKKSCSQVTFSEMSFFANGYCLWQCAMRETLISYQMVL